MKLFLCLTLFFLASLRSSSASGNGLRHGLVERFLRYVVIDTQAKEGVEKIPSTPGQRELANVLCQELTELGLLNVRVDDQGYVYATLPASKGLANPSSVPAVGFIAHLDTSDAVAETRIKPYIVESYSGGDIPLPANALRTITVAKNPDLHEMIGDTIIASDGTSILGGDDKAGIAEIVTAIEFLTAHPEILHGTVQIAFTPDEEVGKGAEKFDVKAFGAFFAYTVDGGEEGELNDETFNAASTVATFRGKSSHPGSAKGQMINSLYAASHFLGQIPNAERPETTEGRDGFFHPYEVKGGEEETVVRLLLRDFEESGLEDRKQRIREIARQTGERFPEVGIQVEITDSYRNMRMVLKDVPHLIEIASEAMRRARVQAKYQPIRGGTDGAAFSFMGLPCANIFTGVHNEHSQEEWVPVGTMTKAVETIVQIVRITAERCW